ncbi:hypothetical protein GEMRC1_010487 [Eukaryota sp. GEM-RC1]
MNDLTKHLADKWQQVNEIQERKTLNADETESQFEKDDLVLRHSGARKGKLHGIPGPYRVIGKKGKNTYEITDLNTKSTYVVSSIHLVPFKADISDIEAMKLAALDNEEFVVDEIQSHAIIDERLLFKVLWKDGCITWEPVQHLEHVEQFKRYIQENRLKAAVKRAKKREREGQC